MLHYMRHNNDVIMDIKSHSKLSGVRFCRFHRKKEELYTKLLIFQGNS